MILPERNPAGRGAMARRRIDRLLWNALIELMEECDLASITVTDIADRAGIHRVTFYRYYEGKEDLLRRGTFRLIEALRERLSGPVASAAEALSGAAPMNFRVVFEYVERNNREIHMLLRNPTFRPMLRSFLEELARDRLGVLTGESFGDAGDLLARYTSAGLMDTIEWWLSRRCSPPTDEMARILGSLVIHGASVVIPPQR